MQLGGGLLEVHADGADALRREPRRHAVREGERCSESEHVQISLRKSIYLATALHPFCSSPELERCLELGVLFAEFVFGTLSPPLHHKTSTLSMPACYEARG